MKAQSHVVDGEKVTTGQISAFLSLIKKINLKIIAIILLFKELFFKIKKVWEVCTNGGERATQL